MKSGNLNIIHATFLERKRAKGIQEPVLGLILKNTLIQFLVTEVRARNGEGTNE
jgi:hypothetical protein